MAGFLHWAAREPETPARATYRTKELNQAGFLGTFDFVYLPIDPDTSANRGYAGASAVACREGSFWSRKGSLHPAGGRPGRGKRVLMLLFSFVLLICPLLLVRFIVFLVLFACFSYCSSCPSLLLPLFLLFSFSLCLCCLSSLSS